ncbi:MAG: FlgD immunoglobulin-like domain containing protein [bacterium]
MVFYKVRTCYQGATSDYVPATVVGTVSLPEPRIMPGQLVNGKLDQLPTEFAIGNFPNPFNPTTTLSYQLPQNALVTLEVYDLMGRKVTTLVQAQKSAGYHSVVWNAKDAAGRSISSGTYLYRFVAQSLSGGKSLIANGKMVLMK